MTSTISLARTRWHIHFDYWLRPRKVFLHYIHPGIAREHYFLTAGVGTQCIVQVRIPLRPIRLYSSKDSVRRPRKTHAMARRGTVNNGQRMRSQLVHGSLQYLPEPSLTMRSGLDMGEAIYPIQTLSPNYCPSWLQSRISGEYNESFPGCRGSWNPRARNRHPSDKGRYSRAIACR